MKENISTQEYNSTITMGLEFEVYDILPALIEGNKVSESGLLYQQQLKKAKKARILNQLLLSDYLPQECAEHEYLAKIKKDDKDFLVVVFDYNNAMSRLEFISANGQVGGGILTANKFLAKENLDDIKRAIKEFGKTIKNSQNKLTTFIPIKNTKFTIELFDYSLPIFANFSTKLSPTLEYGGSIHVTHTCPVNLSKGSDTLFVTNNPLMGSKPVPLLSREQTTTKFSTDNRNLNTPNPKTPLEFIDNDSIDKKIFTENQLKYAQHYKKGEVLYPMSNIVKYLEKDIELYKEVRKDILKINKDENLSRAVTKLENTIGQLSNLIKDKSQDELIFHSYEEKLQPLIGKSFLVEHRSKSQLIPSFCENYIKKNKYDEQQRDQIINNFKIIDQSLNQDLPFSKPTLPTKENTLSKPKNILQDNKKVNSLTMPIAKQIIVKGQFNVKNILQDKNPTIKKDNILSDPSEKTEKSYLRTTVSTSNKNTNKKVPATTQLETKSDKWVDKKVVINKVGWDNSK
jgi:hypothetical protein